MTDLQETDARLQAANDSTYAELRKLRGEIDTVTTDDVAAYAEALAEGGTLPKPRATKLKERVKDLELRVIPAIDEAMWAFACRARDELRRHVPLGPEQQARWDELDHRLSGLEDKKHELCARRIHMLRVEGQRSGLVLGPEKKAQLAQLEAELESLTNHEQDAILREQLDADRNLGNRYATQLKRWQPPDTNRRDQPAIPQHMEKRPKSILAWVENGVAVMDRELDKNAAQHLKDERQRAAARAVDAAQGEYNREQQRLLSEHQETMSPEARGSQIAQQERMQTPPWPEFNRYRWLREHDLLDDYGYVQRGAVVQVKGGNEQRIEQETPRKDMMSPAPNAEPALTATEA
jgi:hypothetical protein